MKFKFLSLWLLAAVTACSNPNAGGDKGIEAGADSATPNEETAGEETAGQAKEKKMRPLSFAFSGDIMMGSLYPSSGHYLTADDGASLFKDIKEINRSVDIAAGNLEGSMIDSGGKPKGCGSREGAGCYTFQMPTRYVNHLLDAGYDFVSIANNHTNDMGEPGRASTMKTLKENGIHFAGLREDCPTTIIEKDGMKIGFTAFDHSDVTLNVADLDEVKRVVGGLKEQCDIVVVSFHGGAEGKNHTHVTKAKELFSGRNRGDVQSFAHTAIDSGADIVYGHGPHVNRAMELYNDRLIMYSLGNFCTPYRFNISGISGYAPLVTVEINEDGTFKEGQIHPFIQQRGVGPRADKSGAVIKNLRNLTQQDFPNTPLAISDDGKISRK